MRGVTPEEQSHPVECIRKEPPHGYRFGVPGEIGREAIQFGVRNRTAGLLEAFPNRQTGGGWHGSVCRRLKVLVLGVIGMHVLLQLLQRFRN